MSKKDDIYKGLLCKIQLTETLYFAEGVWSNREELKESMVLEQREIKIERKLPKGTVLFCKHNSEEVELPFSDRLVYGYLKNGTAPIVFENLELLNESKYWVELEFDAEDILKIKEFNEEKTPQKNEEKFL